MHDPDALSADAPVVRPFREDAEGFRWAGVPVKAYKPDGTHFEGITRQILFDGTGDLSAQLRYFEVAPGGHSTLELHRHVHAVLVLRGRGRTLVGHDVRPVAAFDLVYVPPMTWHQFRADDDAALGFLCLVDCDRDRPVRPTPEDLAALREHPDVAAFIRV